MPTENHLSEIKTLAAPALRIKFDANQDFQLDAVKSVVDLFDGWRRDASDFALQGGEVVANLSAEQTFDRQWLLANLQQVQERNGIDISVALQTDSAMELAGVGDGSWDYQSFTVEMETGTGKTYVYLRTILELRKTYGFRKFVIVVPSVAIYEGVAKAFAITRTHFASLYGNEPIHLIRYDGAQLSRLRDFANSSACEVLLITLDAFNKASNNLYKPSEKLLGERRPYQFVQETRPILILDEPQNMESTLAQSALATLHPLFALRYSATHREIRNQIYRLTPFQAFKRNLVKRIQVFGVTDREDLNRPTLILTKITGNGSQTRARVLTDVDDRGVTRQREVVLKHGDDLHEKTGRPEHRKGYKVMEIHSGDRWIQFENGITVREGETLGASKPEIFRAQIRETIRAHMYAQEHLHERAIKVLSLFFIDRVANYTSPEGIIRKIFDQEFRKLRSSYAFFETLDPDEVRDAYFAVKKRPKTDEFESVDIALDEIKQKKEDRDAAKRAFELIMRKKEQLLSFDEKVCFIFAHSALKEGWDNPNVFQICTLNQTVSEMKKRQEIGRGLRLCVNQKGERVPGDEINILTVIANESYQAYADGLQREYFEDGQADPDLPKPTDAKRKSARRNERIFTANNNFREFWRRLAQRVRYDIQLDSESLMWRCVAALEQAVFPVSKVVVQKGDFVTYNYTFTLRDVRPERARIELVAENTRGDANSVVREYAVGDDMGRILNDERLRFFTLLEVATGRQVVTFENKVELERGLPRSWTSSAGQRVREQSTVTPTTRYPVFNLIDRAQRETQLTRATLNKIFKHLSRNVQEKLIANPEGFAGVFISVIRSTLADAVAESVVFHVDGDEPIDLDGMFPKEQRLAQKELIDAGENSLYDLVQKDSLVEEAFIEKLKTDQSVELYFKFPPKFKVGLPRVIGNYNPDWGIVRRASDGRISLHLVRETKGTEDLEKLRFPHEKRKIVCARKYFEAAQIDYRVITERTARWWTREESVDRQLQLEDL